MGSIVADALSEKLGTEVRIGNVDVGMLNRIIIDNIYIEDQQGKHMLTAPRASVKINILDIINGKISISSAQLFGLKANLYKATADSKTNFQFVIDSLSSKENKEKKPLNLQISSLVIRRGAISYNQLDDNSKNFSTKHINVSDLSAHIILNTLTNDSINANIKRISFNDRSGLRVKQIAMKLEAGKSKAELSDFELALPNTSLQIPLLSATYKTSDGKIQNGSLRLKGDIKSNNITLSDLTAFAPIFESYSTPISLLTSFSGTDSSAFIDIKNLKQSDDIDIRGQISLNKEENTIQWNGDNIHLLTSSDGISHILTMLGKGDAFPNNLSELGRIAITAQGKGFDKNGQGSIDILTDAGNVNALISKDGNNITTDIKTEAIALGKILGSDDIGNLTANINAKGSLANGGISNGSANADIKEIMLHGYNYSDINLQAMLSAERMLHAIAKVNDPACRVNAEGDINLATSTPSCAVTADVLGLKPQTLNLTDKWGDAEFAFSFDGDLHGSNINDATGNIHVGNFNMLSTDEKYHFNNLNIAKAQDPSGRKTLNIKSDFASVSVDGDFDYSTLVNSVTNAIYDRLPTMPGLTRKPQTNNNIKVYATISRSDWAEKLLRIPINIHEPVYLIASIDDAHRDVNINLDASRFTYNGSTFRDGTLYMSSPNDTLRTRISVEKIGSDAKTSYYQVNAKAINNHLNASLGFDIDGRRTLRGTLNADANFHTNTEGLSQADVRILPSEVLVADSAWAIKPAMITYYKDNLEVRGFSVEHANQHLTINGIASKNADDELRVKLKDIDVAYVLDMVNFHSVEFEGFATGTARARNLFGHPEADAHLDVKNFRFESGRMGTLSADANWNLEEGAINIDAVAKDEGDIRTYITGFVSPKNSELDLHCRAEGTRLEFLGKFCDSFLDHVDAYGTGNVEVVGPFKEIQLVGEAVVNGKTNVTPLNTTYEIRNAHARLVPDDIQLLNDSIVDRDGHYGILSGHLRHKHLGQFTYDIDISAENLLAFDTHDFGDDTFYGTVYATGDCAIRGKSGEVIIDIDAVPQEGSVLVYNAASPDAISNREFIHWTDRNEKKAVVGEVASTTAETPEMDANLYLNFLIHCTPDATLKVLMDQTSGDYIALNGNGVIRAAYYNKGSFDLFGNYNVERGNYRLTIQNVIKRDFEFLPGGTIAFGGDAYNAALNLPAQYTLASVPLSDINVGKSFTNNNIRVDCLMNITGTPGQPHVDFSLDIPTVSTDAKQMIMSLMNSEEETNQQVIYLLAFGRFLNQGSNNAYAEDASRRNQTSLVMQSILSGTISQQLSSVLENAVGNNNWNLGANISTGDEGMKNAEYEGLLSGRLLNNRLLINGQFGYRDNQNATSSFIGDFDLRYLLRPDGGIAINVYNQTNDRYFTKNSLNTQGIGLILKKDFNSIFDLFPWRRKKAPLISQ